VAKTFIISIIFIILVCKDTIAQKGTETYYTKFIPETVTYNGSDNPNECWESVDWGIRIKTDKCDSFFNMDYKNIERIKKQIGDAEVQIEVIYYDKTYDKSGAVGSILKITFANEVVYNKE
jgi:hypothetical protein